MKILLTTLLLLSAQADALTCYCNYCDDIETCSAVQCYVQLVFDTVTCREEPLVYGCQSNVLTHLCSRPGKYTSGRHVVKYACCVNESYCNRNLSLNSSDINCISSPVSNTPTPSVPTTDHQALTLAIAVPLGASFVLCIFVTIICILPLIILKKRRSPSQSPFHPISPAKNQTDHRSSLNTMGSIHVSASNDMQMTCTSGSGLGLPRLTKRTIAHNIRLEGKIGEGAFGQVYLGYYQGEKYAVKIFFSKDEQSWSQECNIYNNLNLKHESILSCFAADMFSNNDGVTELWLITQFHPRGSLYNELNRNTLDKQKMMSVVLSICRGLVYLHTELTGTQCKPAVAHRDIKTKNILVKNDWTCCIADFGLAIVNCANGPMLTNPEDVTRGTKRYMSPEILSGTINVRRIVSFLRSDVYSFGLVMWEICRRYENENSKAEEYSCPFQLELSAPNPSFEDMRELLVNKGTTLEIPDKWNDNELLKGLTLIIKECCHRNPLGRPTALNIRNKLVKLADSDSDIKYTLI